MSIRDDDNCEPAVTPEARGAHRTRRAVARALVAAAFATTGLHPAHAQPEARRPRRIGYLSPSPAGHPRVAGRLAALHAGMQEQGWAPGRDYLIDVRSVDGENSRYPALVQALLAEGTELLIAAGNTAAAAVRGQSQRPVVFVGAGDPVASGMAHSLAGPGGHATGRSAMTQELDGKRLELLRELLPSLRRVGALAGASQPGSREAGPNHRRGLAELHMAAQRLGIEVTVALANTAQDFEPAFARFRAARAQGLVLFDQSLFLSHAQTLQALIRQSRLAAMFQQRDWLAAGGLISYGLNSDAEHRLLAGPVVKILTGTPPGEIPIQQPTRIDLSLNRRAATELGLTIPNLLLLRAADVIE